MQELGNANALHRARSHTARLLGAIVPCMYTKHAITWQCECIAPCPQAQSTASRSHIAVHALKACKTWQCECIAPCPQAHSPAFRSHGAVHAIAACKLGNANAQCECIAPCPQAYSTASRSYGAVHALKACQNLAMRVHCTVPAGTQHGS